MKNTSLFKLLPPTVLLNFIYFLPLNVNSQVFEEMEKNPFGLSDIGTIIRPMFIDLDNDNDLDLFVGETMGGFNYIINDGTAATPLFENGFYNPFSLTGITIEDQESRPLLADFDNDNDYDLLVMGFTTDFYYFENIGSAAAPAFEEMLVNPFSLTTMETVQNSPAACDIDGDNDFDLLIGTGSPSSFIFIKNIGTSETPLFGSKVVNPFSLNSDASLLSPYFVDFDFDNDHDLFCGSSSGDFFYYKNIGSSLAPNFDTPVSDPFSLYSTGFPYSCPSLGDIDADGDFDLISGGEYGDFYYYQNISLPTTINLNSTPVVGIKLIPNPSDSYINIEVQPTQNEAKLSLNICNAFGQIVLTNTTIKPSSNYIDVSGFPAGLYFVNIFENNFISSTRISFIKK